MQLTRSPRMSEIKDEDFEPIEKDGKLNAPQNRRAMPFPAQSLARASCQWLQGLRISGGRCAHLRTSLQAKPVAPERQGMDSRWR